MSIPPQLIRVKRKRVDEEAPVKFLQFDKDGTKRHRTGDNWVYRRRETAVPPLDIASQPRDAPPVIQVSKPPGAGTNSTELHRDAPTSTIANRKTLSPRPSLQKLRPEPRKFHLSRSLLAAARDEASVSGIRKKRSSSPAVFVERSRNRAIRKVAQSTTLARAASKEQQPHEDPIVADNEPKEVFKKPGTTRAKSTQQEAPSRAPLPDTFSNMRNEDMSKRADDMNQWVLNEIGANLHEMEVEKKQAERPRFRPKAPAKRFAERHPELAAPKQPNPEDDSVMRDISDEEAEDDDDWIIEEYVRVPAKSMAIDVSAADIGVIVFDGDEDSTLFFGDDYDEDDDYAEDDEDENAENHYTADYPEDEVDSDDEYGRHPYLYRNTNASDDEEYDNAYYSDSDDMVLEGGGDDDATMARIKAYMRRHQDR